MNFLSLLAGGAQLTPMKWENIKPTLTILWQGLVAIFVVIGLIILAVQLTKFCVKKAENAKKRARKNCRTRGFGRRSGKRIAVTAWLLRLFGCIRGKGENEKQTETNAPLSQRRRALR